MSVEADPLQIAQRETENAINQFDLLFEMIQEHVANGGKKFKLTQSAILKLQQAALNGIHSLAGTYRNSGISISGSSHRPLDHSDAADSMADLCAYVNDHWFDKSAVHLGAYVLWRLNWIHPFADGNGRTARAVSYLVTSVKIGSLLPGTPTIPEQIAADKGPYYDALESADAALQSTNLIDVSKLEQLLERMLMNQLLNEPSLTLSAQKRFQETVEDRIRRAPEAILARCFGSKSPKAHLWAIGEFRVLQVASDKVLSDTETRQQTGDPFPQLLADDTAQAERVFTGSSSVYEGTIALSTPNTYAIGLARDEAVTLLNFSVTDAANSGSVLWETTGALYIVHLGTTISNENFNDTFDLMIAKHLSLQQDH